MVSGGRAVHRGAINMLRRRTANPKAIREMAQITDPERTTKTMDWRDMSVRTVGLC